VTLLLNPRLWIALALAGLLAFSHFTAYRKGKANVRTEWTAAVATANAEARRLEQARQRRADEAAQMAAAREGRIRADAAGARRESDGLRDDLSATREHARQSLDACTVSLAAAADVFQSCASRYSELAEDADRHASDSLKLQQAWPK
jgi:hypothetical protein